MAPHAQGTSSDKVGSSKGELDGKLAIVTGGSRGIGSAIAENLASKGANLVLGYTSSSSKDTAEKLCERLNKEYNVTAISVQADMATETGPAQLVTSTKEFFADSANGKFKIDIIINNAGVAGNDMLKEVTIDDFNRQYKTNVLGPLLLVQSAMDYLPTDRSGRIVNVSSVSATMGFPAQTVYGGTKAALESMTRTWSRELAERATVNSINPGPVATDMWAGVSDDFMKGMQPWMSTTPLEAVREGIDSAKLVEDAKIAGGRPAYVEEIGGVVGMLCTKDAAWITGQSVCANGGMRMAI